MAPNPRFSISVSPRRKRLLVRVVVPCLVVLVLLVVASPLRQIGVGERGVLYNNLTGRTSPRCLDSGWHFVIPVVHRVTTYPITAHTFAVARDAKTWLQGQDSSLWVPTNDSQKVNLDVYFTYQLQPDRLQDIFHRFDGKSIDRVESEYLDKVFKSAVISVVTKSTMLQVYAEGRTAVQDEIKSLLQRELGPLGIDIQIVLFEAVRLMPEAEAVLAAEARRQATVIEAQGTRDANQLISQSLTDELVRLRSLEKLSADLKVIMLPVTGNSLLDLSSLLEGLGGTSGTPPGPQK